jgi:hypothetical protein
MLQCLAIIPTLPQSALTKRLSWYVSKPQSLIPFQKKKNERMLDTLPHALSLCNVNSAIPNGFVPPTLLLDERQLPSRLRLCCTMEATQGQMHGFFSQLLRKCHLEEVLFVGC